MHLFRVLIPVSDIEKAATFYSALLDMPGTRVSAGRHYFDCGGTILACFDPQADGDGYEARPNPECIYLSTQDLEGVFARARLVGADFPEETLPNVGPLGEISARPWGETSFYIADPFGNPLCFVDETTCFTV